MNENRENRGRGEKKRETRKNEIREDRERGEKEGERE